MFATKDAKINVRQCYACGELAMLACTMDDTFKMRVDGKLHDVPVKRVPCTHCGNCGTTLMDDASDAQIQCYYEKYLVENNLNTRWLRFKRYWRRKFLALQCRYEYNVMLFWRWFYNTQ